MEKKERKSTSMHSLSYIINVHRTLKSVLGKSRYLFHSDIYQKKSSVSFFDILSGLHFTQNTYVYIYFYLKISFVILVLWLLFLFFFVETNSTIQQDVKLKHVFTKTGHVCLPLRGEP